MTCKRCGCPEADHQPDEWDEGDTSCLGCGCMTFTPATTGRWPW